MKAFNIKAPLRARIGNNRPNVSSRAASASASYSHVNRLMQWLDDKGVKDLKVELSDKVLSSLDTRRPLDVTVAATHIAAGDTAISIPAKYTLNLASFFNDNEAAELLTTDKFSELAALTLFLMYEKKQGTDSEYYAFIKELDSVRARSYQGVESPLLWSEEEVNTYLAGSPVVAEVAQRLEVIRKEWKGLDEYFFLSPVLRERYPRLGYPSEVFTEKLFIQAFTAIQASIVHLRGEGVSSAQRFSVIPLGPPTLTWSTMSKSLFSYDAATNSVVLKVDRAYEPGQQVVAWCGPQTNAKLLQNYGVVADGLLGTEMNPVDKMILVGTVSQTDPAFARKKQILGANSLASQQRFDLQLGRPIPTTLLPWLRLAVATGAEVDAVKFGPGAKPVNEANEARARWLIIGTISQQLYRYKSSVEDDTAAITSPATAPRERAARRLLRLEKMTLKGVAEELAVDALRSPPGSGAAVAPQAWWPKLTFSP